jgi:hypothetical protein
MLDSSSFVCVRTSHFKLNVWSFFRTCGLFFCRNSRASLSCVQHERNKGSLSCSKAPSSKEGMHAVFLRTVLKRFFLSHRVKTEGGADDAEETTQQVQAPASPVHLLWFSLTKLWSFIVYSFLSQVAQVTSSVKALSVTAASPPVPPCVGDGPRDGRGGGDEEEYVLPLDKKEVCTRMPFGSAGVPTQLTTNTFALNFLPERVVRGFSLWVIGFLSPPKKLRHTLIVLVSPRCRV